MFLRKWLKRLAKFIRGGPGPLPTFLSCLIGFLLGMNPSFNLTWVLGLLVLIVLNTNIIMSVLCMVLGRLAAFALAPVTFEIGYFVIHGMGLEGLFTAAGDTPVLALMDLHYYCVVGGILVGLPLGAVLGVVAAKLLQAVRKAIAAMVAGEKAQKLLSKKYVRIFVWLLIGGSKQTIAETLTARQPLLRKSGLIVCGVLVVVLVGGPMLLSGSMLANAIASQLTQANGAEVDIASAELSLAGGQFGLSGLQVTDRSKPTHNLAQVATLSADLSVTRLLAKQMVVDEMTLTLLETGVARSSPGKVLDPPPPSPRRPPTTRRKRRDASSPSTSPTRRTSRRPSSGSRSSATTWPNARSSPRPKRTSGPRPPGAMPRPADTSPCRPPTSCPGARNC